MKAGVLLLEEEGERMYILTLITAILFAAVLFMFVPVTLMRLRIDPMIISCEPVYDICARIFNKLVIALVISLTLTLTAGVIVWGIQLFS